MSASIYSAREFTIRRMIREQAPPSRVRDEAEEVALRHLHEGISAARSVDAGKIFLRLHGIVGRGTTSPEPAA